jgi:hypothetical protein
VPVPQTPGSGDNTRAPGGNDEECLGRIAGANDEFPELTGNPPEASRNLLQLFIGEQREDNHIPQQFTGFDCGAFHRQDDKRITEGCHYTNL